MPERPTPKEAAGDSLKNSVKAMDGKTFTTWSEFVAQARALSKQVDDFNGAYGDHHKRPQTSLGYAKRAGIIVVDKTATLDLLMMGESDYELDFKVTEKQPLPGDKTPGLDPMEILFYRDVLGLDVSGGSAAKKEPAS